MEMLIFVLFVVVVCVFFLFLCTCCFCVCVCVFFGGLQGFKLLYVEMFVSKFV